MHKVLALVITLVGVSGLWGQGGESYLVTVSDVSTTPSPDNGAPGMKEDVFFAKFKATLRNTTDRAIFVSVDPVIRVKAEILLPSGGWKTMAIYSSFYTKDPKYPQCTKVERGKTFTFPNMTDMVVLGRDRPADSTANVRFYFSNACMVRAATHSTNFLTERIEINR